MQVAASQTSPGTVAIHTNLTSPGSDSSPRRSPSSRRWVRCFWRRTSITALTIMMLFAVKSWGVEGQLMWLKAWRRCAWRWINLLAEHLCCISIQVERSFAFDFDEAAIEIQKQCALLNAWLCQDISHKFISHVYTRTRWNWITSQWMRLFLNLKRRFLVASAIFQYSVTVLMHFVSLSFSVEPDIWLHIGHCSYFLHILTRKATQNRDKNGFRDLSMYVTSALRGGLTFGNLGVKYRGITKYETLAFDGPV